MSSGRRFLLTPLREGRHSFPVSRYSPFAISTHAPAGGATRPRWKLARSRSTFLLTPLREGRRVALSANALREVFLLTPLREGRLYPPCRARRRRGYFYSRPCGRGDWPEWLSQIRPGNFYSRPCGRGDLRVVVIRSQLAHISTHAPAGGATES